MSDVHLTKNLEAKGARVLISEVYREIGRGNDTSWTSVRLCLGKALGHVREVIKAERELSRIEREKRGAEILK